MASMSPHHQELTNGEGKCSVPMWGADGWPAGFCDKPAFGRRPDGETFRDPNTGKVTRYDGRYSGYTPGLACVSHGGPEYDKQAEEIATLRARVEELENALGERGDKETDLILMTARAEKAEEAFNILKPGYIAMLDRLRWIDKHVFEFWKESIGSYGNQFLVNDSAGRLSIVDRGGEET